MKFAIRADASLKIGSGHIMRCLTLANALREDGNEVRFICRLHQGNLIEWIKTKGFMVSVLSQPSKDSDKALFHSEWLGATQLQDAEECAILLKEYSVDWLIVDHYALDKTWQQALKPLYQKLLVIDDLGDREHICDVLLDQNYGSLPGKYHELVPTYCQVLTGSEFALLRPEFDFWRKYSLQRRKSPELKELLINLGGVDADNLTTVLLEQLESCNLPEEMSVNVVMGATAPHLVQVQEAAENSKYAVEVEIGVTNMAERMANADLAIGAAGSTTWERCCLGLPTIQLVIAENQRTIAQLLAQANAVIILEEVQGLSQALNLAKARLGELSRNSLKIVDGKGTLKVSRLLNKMYLSVEGDRLIPYESLTLSQSRFVLDMRNHMEIRKWMHQRKEIAFSEHLAFISALLNRTDRHFFVVQCGDSILGTINFTDIDEEEKSAEFGIFANPFLHEKGRGKKLIALALEYARNRLHLQQLNLVVFSDNVAAVGLYKKFGFSEVSQKEKEEKPLIHMKKEITKSMKNEN